MREEKNTKLVGILVSVIAVLFLMVLYLVAVRPAINGYIIKSQNEGVQYTIGAIAQQAVTCQKVSLPVGNQTLELIAVGCLPAGCLQQTQPTQ